MRRVGLFLRTVCAPALAMPAGRGRRPRPHGPAGWLEKPSGIGRAPARRRSGAALLLAVAVAVACPSAAGAQCAMCRSAFDSPEGQRMIRHYRAGIVFLLSVPIATFATVAYLAVRNRRRLKAEEDDTG